MMTKHLVVVSGGLSEESTTHRLAAALTKATQSAVSQTSGPSVEVRVTRLDVRDFAHEIASASLTGFASGALAQAYDALASADGVIAVTPTYKASYTGLFKAFWDVTPDGMMSGVPVLVGATGGTPRHSLVTDTALRPLFGYMKALTLPTAIYAAAEDWGSSGLMRRIDEAAAELADALMVGGSPAGGTDDPEASGTTDGPRTLGGTRSRANDPFSSVPTMEQMLGR